MAHFLGEKNLNFFFKNLAIFWKKCQKSQKMKAQILCFQIFWKKKFKISTEPIIAYLKPTSWPIIWYRNCFPPSNGMQGTQLWILPKIPKIAQNCSKYPKIRQKTGVLGKKIGFRCFRFFCYRNLWANHWCRNFSKKVQNNFFWAEKKVFSKIQRGDHWKIGQFSLGPPSGFRGLEIFFSFFGRPEGLRRRNYREAEPRRTKPAAGAERSEVGVSRKR